MSSGVANLLVDIEGKGDQPPPWVHLIPGGRFLGIDGRGPYWVANSASLIATSMRDGRPLPIDYNHAGEHARKVGGEAPAAGWIVELQARQDGIWGRVDWTAKGARAVAQREYRFLSPAFTQQDGRVLCIVSAAVTNTPNLEALVALNTRRVEVMAVALTKSASRNSAADTELCTILGLPAGTDQAAANNTVRSLTGALAAFQIALCNAMGVEQTTDGNAIVEMVRSLAMETHTPDPTRFVPIGVLRDTLSELNRVHSGQSRQSAELMVDQAIRERSITPGMRDWAIELCTANTASFQSFVGGVGKPVAALLAGLDTPARAPAGAGRPSVSPHSESVGKSLGIDPEKLSGEMVTHAAEVARKGAAQAKPPPTFDSVMDVLGIKPDPAVALGKQRQILQEARANYETAVAAGKV